MLPFDDIIMFNNSEQLMNDTKEIDLITPLLTTMHFDFFSWNEIYVFILYRAVNYLTLWSFNIILL